jgi:predicted RNA-binding protein with TRAM domain
LNILNLYSRSGNIGGIFGGSKALRKTPVSVREEYDVRIEDGNRQGAAGTDKIKGFVVFVNNANG